MPMMRCCRWGRSIAAKIIAATMDAAWREWRVKCRADSPGAHAGQAEGDAPCHGDRRRRRSIPREAATFSVGHRRHVDGQQQRDAASRGPTRRRWFQRAVAAARYYSPLMRRCRRSSRYRRADSVTSFSHHTILIWLAKTIIINRAYCAACEWSSLRQCRPRKTEAIPHKKDGVMISISVARARHVTSAAFRPQQHIAMSHD